MPTVSRSAGIQRPPRASAAPRAACRSAAPGRSGLAAWSHAPRRPADLVHDAGQLADQLIALLRAPAPSDVGLNYRHCLLLSAVSTQRDSPTTRGRGSRTEK